MTNTIRCGIIGTGYAANQRAQTLREELRSQLLVFSGHSPEKTQEFAQTHQILALNSWQEVIAHPDIDLVFICTINRDRGTIVRAALEAGKDVVVEYPISLDPTEAESLINLAQTKGKLLHVEHIELLGGLHNAMRQFLPEIGNPFYARYVTMVPKSPAPRRWTYNRELFGFPFQAALPHIHRFTNLFGTVESVTCQSRYWWTTEDYYRACLCTGQLKFTNGLIADVTYSKGETCWQSLRNFEVHGEKGTLLFEGEKGMLIRGEEKTPIEVEGRRGLFVKDTQMVLDYLTEGKPLYVSSQDSLYALQVGEMARQSAGE
ncbi:MAG TPA: glycosyl transferase family 2 [Cyanobacteria bacterium UBA11149]|nr:glycosyl transferase family 2 [Cyanobacteria bacterium UBA11367]HBE58263.1 glycosyl transferase family 2 [Cyanobacteria bacterium UBA11366]HBK63974.1 glycosyl transferase family 2 [Cyanobacteria bacterium UBA11166]HBR73855.1 glycosyl transferase family 2 [Cyanobacteria bacterium UBA11159]HBS71243.1 glycosyl transferase family 2 [Cyanobacteria bacterium UBA11153]HBW87327.1 glycosyl transferase family 2 [Cyanobacteria bacterium UBA11149]HCA94208.1 glycosyl transferase family 2 [Cyanobacteria